jgi:hypothetical protein
MAIKNIFGQGMKISVETSNVRPGATPALVVLGTGPGRFESVMGLYDETLRTGVVDGHQLTEDQQAWLVEQRKAIDEIVGWQ